MPEIRQFESGANRDSDVGKLDYEGFFSPLVMEEYARYMHGCRQLPDGSLRDSDNWQKGIPLTVYMKSLFRHFVDVWKLHRGVPITTLDRFTKQPVTLKVALCAALFNTMGYLHEILKAERAAQDNEQKAA
jgi:hypothetical protein